VSDAVLQVTDATFDQEVVRSDRPVVIDFWAPWCAPCRVLDPLIHDLAAQYPGAKFVKLDTDLNPAAAARYQVLSLPTVLVLERGEERKRLRGSMGKNKLASELAPWLGAAAAA
jgi:thioredoxin 1